MGVVGVQDNGLAAQLAGGGLHGLLPGQLKEVEEVGAGVLDAVGGELAAVVFQGLVVVAVVVGAHVHHVEAALHGHRVPEAAVVGRGLVAQEDAVAAGQGAQILAVGADEGKAALALLPGGHDQGVLGRGKHQEVAGDGVLHGAQAAVARGVGHAELFLVVEDHVLPAVAQLRGPLGGLRQPVEVEEIDGGVLDAVGGKAVVPLDGLVVVAVVVGAHAHDVIAALHGDELPLRQVRGPVLLEAQAVTGGAGGQVALFAPQGVIAVFRVGHAHGEDGSALVKGDAVLEARGIHGVETAGVGGGVQADDGCVGVVVENDLIALGQLLGADLPGGEVALQTGGGAEVAAVVQPPAPGEGSGVDLALVLDVLQNGLLDVAAAQVVVLVPDGVVRAEGAEAAAGVAQVVGVAGHDVGLVHGELPAVGKALDDDPAALGLVHVVGEVQAAEDHVGKVVADGGVADGAVLDRGLEPGGGVLLQHVLDLLTGQGQDVEHVVVVLVHLDDGLHGDLAGFHIVVVARNGRGRGHVHVNVVEAGGRVKGRLLLVGVVLEGQVLGAIGLLHVVDQIDGVGLLQVVVVGGIPLAHGIAGHLVHVLGGHLGVGHDLGLEGLVHGVAAQAQVPGLLDHILQLAVAVLREGENGLGELGAAAVDHQHVLAVLVLEIVVGVGAGVVVTGDDHVDALALGDHAGHLALGVLAEDQLAGGGAGAGVVGDDDELTALGLHHGQVVLDLPGCGALGVLGVGEDDAGVVVRNVPAGAVGVLQAQDADLVLDAADAEALDQVGSEDVLARLVDAVAAVVVEVGGDDGHAAAGQVLVGLCHGGPGVVELMVAQDGHVVADITQAEGHRGRFTALAGGDLAQLHRGNRGALVEVAVVDQQHVVAVGLPILGNSRGNPKHGVVFVAVCQNVLVPALAVHIRGGQHDEIQACSFLGRFCREAHGQQGQHHGQCQKQCQDSLGKVFFHTAYSFS